MRVLIIRITLWLLVLPWAAQAQAFDCASVDTPEFAAGLTHRDRLNALEQNGCLGGANDTDALTAAVVAALPDGRTPPQLGVSDQERRAATLHALDRIAAAADAELAALPPTAAPGAAERLEALAAALAAARAAVADGRDGEGPQRPVYWKFNRDNGSFTLAADDGAGLGVQLYRGFLDDACRAPDSADCAHAYALAKNIVRDAHLVERSLTYYAAPVLDAHYREALLRDRKWRAYFDEALFQYPWELYLNGIWLRKHDPRPRDAAGNRLGFLPPPSSQWIVLHPNIGFEYVSGAADGNQFEPAVFIELIGYNRWQWTASGEIADALGVSLITSYSDRAGADDAGYGLLLHYGSRWSLAATRHGADTGWLLSADLAQLVGDTSERARALMRFGE